MVDYTCVDSECPRVDIPPSRVVVEAVARIARVGCAAEEAGLPNVVWSWDHFCAAPVLSLVADTLWNYIKDRVIARTMRRKWEIVRFAYFRGGNRGRLASGSMDF